MTRPPAVDLFGEPIRQETKGEVTLAMILVDQTEKAWLLSREGQPRRSRWIPKSRCARGEGRDAHLFTMSRADAAERGWRE